MRIRNSWLISGTVIALLGVCRGETPEDSGQVPADPETVFAQRIMPIFRSPDPASCVQCHLASVDLKDYIRPSHEQTFASLRDQGLINLSAPEDSKILKLIAMGDDDTDAKARRIHAATRKAEYEAFAAWIRACCDDPTLRSLPALPEDQLTGPAAPVDVIRHHRRSRLVDSFERHIWSQRMRCFPCHTPHELDESDPKQKVAIRRYEQFLEQHGPRFGDRLTIFHETPEATMEYLIQRSLDAPQGELPLLNLEHPELSLLVLKPTSKLPPRNQHNEFASPSYQPPVSHLGGLKMHEDDASYKAFLAWIRDYASVTRGRYTAVDDLPADNWYPTKHVIIVRRVPESWPAGSRIQFFVHPWDPDTKQFADAPVAFTQAQVGPAGNVAGALFLLGTPGREAVAAPPQTTTANHRHLPPGRYLLKACRDQSGRLQDDPTLLLDEDDFVGYAEIEASWGEGFKNAEKLTGADLILASD